MYSWLDVQLYFIYHVLYTREENDLPVLQLNPANCELEQITRLVVSLIPLLQWVGREARGDFVDIDKGTQANLEANHS